MIGATGLLFVDIALKDAAEPAMNLLVRSESKLKPEWRSNPRINIIVGALDDTDAIAKAVPGVNAVISFLGAYVSLGSMISRDKSTPIGDSFPIIINAMRANSVKRILVLSTPSAYPVPEDELSLGWKLYCMMPPALVPQGNAEMKAIAYNVATQDDLDWTVMRVPHLTEHAEDLQVAAGPLGPEFRGTRALSRGSLARWALRELSQNEWIKSAPALGNYS